MVSPLLIPSIVVALGVTWAFLWWVRRIEVNHREPWRIIFIAFLIGAFVTVVGGGALESLLIIPLQGLITDFSFLDVAFVGFLGAVLIAPVAEELMKALGVIAMRHWITEVEDGIVYGVAVGLGFAATENILYFGSAIATGGVVALAGTVVVRSLTSTLLHLGATGLSGYGFGVYYGQCNQKSRWGIYVFGAMLLHGVFNLFASLQIFGSSMVGQIVFGLTGLFLGVVLVWSLFIWLQKRLHDLDRRMFVPECA